MHYVGGWPAIAMAGAAYLAGDGRSMQIGGVGGMGAFKTTGKVGRNAVRQGSCAVPMKSAGRGRTPLFGGQKRCIGICIKRMKQATRPMFWPFVLHRG